MWKNLTGRIRTIDLGITIVNFYSPPLYQLSYGELCVHWPSASDLIFSKSKVIVAPLLVKTFLNALQNFSHATDHQESYKNSVSNITTRQCVRVVKEPDLKSGGLCPRRFESCRWRYYHTSVDSSVVRIPAFQAGGPGSIPGRRIAPLV